MTLCSDNLFTEAYYPSPRCVNRQALLCGTCFMIRYFNNSNIGRIVAAVVITAIRSFNSSAQVVNGSCKSGKQIITLSRSNFHAMVIFSHPSALIKLLSNASTPQRKSYLRPDDSAIGFPSNRKSPKAFINPPEHFCF